MLLLLGAGAGGAYWWTQRGDSNSAGTDPAAAPITGRRPGGNRTQPVSVQAVRQQDVRVVVPAIGTITALNTATVRARVDGELRRLHFQEGQQVQAGQLLAELDPRALEVALAQAQGQLARDAAQLRNAELDLARYKDLLAKDSVARQQVDTQEALVRQLQGTVQADQASVDGAKLQLSYTRITAPIGGRLGLRQVDLGNVVRASDANGLVTVTQTRPISVVFAVPEVHLGAIRRKLAAGQPLTVEAWDREQRNRLARGQVKTTDNAIDTATGTLRLKAQFANSDDALFPNQFVNIRLQLDTVAQALVVPAAAIQRGSVGTFVYVVKEDSTVTLRRVTPGAVDGDWVSVEGDLAPGDRVVTDGADRLREGAKVEVIARQGRPGGGAQGGSGQGAASGDAKGEQKSGAKGGAKGGDSGPSSAGQSAAGRDRAAPGPVGAPAADAARAAGAAGGRAPVADAGGELPPWFDRLPPELQDKFKKMNADERRDFIEKMRERRRQREAQQGQ